MVLPRRRGLGTVDIIISSPECPRRSCWRGEGPSGRPARYAWTYRCRAGTGVVDIALAIKADGSTGFRGGGGAARRALEEYFTGKLLGRTSCWPGWAIWFTRRSRGKLPLYSPAGTSRSARISFRAGQPDRHGDGGVSMYSDTEGMLRPWGFTTWMAATAPRAGGPGEQWTGFSRGWRRWAGDHTGDGAGPGP